MKLEHTGKQIILIVVLMLSSFATRAQESNSDSATSTTSTAVSKAKFLICRNKKQVRTVNIESRADGGCNAIYVREGVSRNEGGGKNPVTCFMILGNIKKNLETSGWKCREVNQMEVIESKDEKSP